MHRFVLRLTVILAMCSGCCCAANAGADDGQPDAGRAQFYHYDDLGNMIGTNLDARRIVSLAPNITEMICALGYGDRLVGRSDYCNYPPDVVAGIPTVGGFVDTSLEAIVALDPDLVVAYQGNSRDLIDQLKALRIPVAGFAEKASVAEIVDQMRLLDNIIRPDRGNHNPVVTELRKRVKERWTNDYFARTPGPAVFFGYPGEMSYTCGPASFLDDVIRLAGCTNVVTDLEDRWPMVGAEFIIAADPDVILTATSCTETQDPKAVREEMLKTLQADPVWSALDAVRLGRIIVIESDMLMRPGPRLLDALDEFIAQLEAMQLEQESVAEDVA